VNERARVPFALVGVLLLVSSATLTATVGSHAPQRTPAVDRAMQGATAETVTALRGAADAAATATAASPVTRPANTTVGRALETNRSFRDALRLRLYLVARDRLEEVSARRGDTVARAALPPVEPTTEGYREAIERVHVERAGEDDAALRVEIEGVELTATRGGRTVARTERSPSFVVANPALSLHDRTERFERRAAAPVTRPGLARRLTARLYPVAWARGYAQYGGAPVANVVANRHVELATNDALLAEQRAVFGAADPAGHRGVAAAGRRVATTDLLVGAGGDEAWTDLVLGGADAVGPDPPARRPVGTWRDPPEDPSVTVDVGTSADRAYAALVGVQGYGRPEREGGDLTDVVERVHTVEARVAADRRPLGVSRRNEGRPGSGWRLVGETNDRHVELVAVDGPPPTATGWSTRDGAAFDAVVTETTTRTWRRGDERTRTESTVERRYRLRLAVQARTVPLEGVPGGDLEGALSSATARATERAVRKAGGLRGAARAAALGQTLPEVRATAEPVTARYRLVADLRDLRERTRNLSVTVPAPAVGTGRSNPPARLRDELAGRRDGLHGEGGSTARARTVLAVRTAYLDELDTRLEKRAATHDEANAGVDDALGEYFDEDRLDGALASHRAAARPDPDPATDPAGEVSLAVDAAPAYLPTSEVGRERLAVRGGGSVRPLAARNVNVFASPHGHVAESILERIPYLGADRVALATAAEALAAAADAPPAERRALEREIEAAVTYVRGELHRAMVEAGVPAPVAREALSTDASTAVEARALVNGTTVDRAVEGVQRGDPDRLRSRLETTLDDALRDERARPRRAPTNATAEAARAAYRERLKEAVERGAETGGERARQRALGERLGSLPAGLPVAPVPGYWYATVNVWYVDVGGAYERFAVRSDRGGPNAPTTYVRDGRRVRLEHDGKRIRLGSAERVAFRVRTAVVVAVPPGGSGVGDTDGEPDERSAGWPPDDPPPNST
jgi:hypothetical protein